MPGNTTLIEPAKEAAQRRKELAQGPRRKYPLDFKLQIMNEIAAPGVSVAAVARRHGMNANLIFRWRREYRAGQLGENRAAAFVPVRVAHEAPALPAPRTPGPAAVAETKPAPRRKAGPSPRRSGCGRAGRFIEIMLPGGYAVRAEADVDDAALRRVLRAVRELS